VIRWFEQLGWVHSVKWPDPERLAARIANAEKAARPIKAA